jgi:cytochrome c553
MARSIPLRSAIRVLVMLATVAVLVFLAQRTPQAQGSSEFFTQKVVPIFEANCVFCHGAKIQRSGLDLRTEQSAIKGGARGASVIAGDPDKSLLYRMMTHREEPAMPLGMDKISDAEIAVIAQWIRQIPVTAAANASPEVIPVRSAGYSITDQDRAWWAFQKPVRPAIPAVKNKAWVKNPIDAFTLKKLEEAGLQPSAPADPRTLLRRVYFDLIGLPPSPEEMTAFLKDPSEAAYQKVIEKLLASQHYGERWGRHWLDLARYADSGGYEFDYDRPHAWRYRDWVIKAFNENLPYDQFIRQQLAGDLLAPDNPEAIIPTGFCRNGPTVDNVENEETRADEMDDMVSATSSVFLGMTVGCARCHDHKYDPIPQKDYYRLQAVFFSSKKTEKPFASPAEIEAHKAANKAIDEQVKPYRQKILEIEKPVRDRLMAEKIDFHVKLAQSSNALEGKTLEEFRQLTSERLRKEVELQAEEIDPLLTPEQIAARKQVRQQMEAINKTRPKMLPAAMGVIENDQPGQAYLLKRGDFRAKGDPVNPGLPQVLSDGTDLDPKIRRRQLADWIASESNPLTSRVMVNRVWQYHFGKGLVRTPSDFGLTGERPTHPELLDWLAVAFRDGETIRAERGMLNVKPQRGRNVHHSSFTIHRFSLKDLHRLILTSNSYRQASHYNEAMAAKDPENRLLWRMHPRRLEAEIIRDSVLSISGKLNPEMYGPGIYPRIDPDIINTGSRARWPLSAKDDRSTWRRSVYIFVKRSVLMPMLEVFDCPVTVVPAPMRPVSTVSPQALALMNNEFILEQAGFLAERVVREAGTDCRPQIHRTFEIALGRKPNAKELEWSEQFIKAQTAGYTERKNEKPEAAALRDFCHAIFNLNEFLYVD